MQCGQLEIIRVIDFASLLFTYVRISNFETIYMMVSTALHLTNENLLKCLYPAIEIRMTSFQPEKCLVETRGVAESDSLTGVSRTYCYIGKTNRKQE